MSRSPVQVRDARPEDGPALLTIWEDFRRTGWERTTTEEELAEAANAVAGIVADPDQSLLVGTIDGAVVGAAHLLRARISPIHADTAVHVTHLHVLNTHRRHGVGRALMEAAVTWAEEKATPRLLAVASVHSRDANRFLARLGLTQIAAVRAASVIALRAKLPVETPVAAMATGRNQRSVGQVLVQRRLQRRARARAD